MNTVASAAVPRDAYTRGLAAAQAASRSFAASARGIARWRLAVFLLLVGGVFLVVAEPGVPAWVLLAPLAAFAWLVARHQRVEAARIRAERAAAFHARGLARLDHTWMGTGSGGERWCPAGHPFADDLDLFGRASLFELLCEARTGAGERTLAGWLLEPAPPAVIASRQEAVRELQPRLGFREALALIGEEVRQRFDERPLVAWAAAPPPSFPAWTLTLCRFVVAALLVSTAGAALGWWPWSVVALPLGAVAAVGFGFRSRVRETIAGVELAARELADLAELLERCEAEPAAAPALVALRQRLAAGDRPASVQVWRLRRLVALLDSRGNQLVMLILPLLLWTTQVACAIARWRREAGPRVGDWIRAAGELEALASLAGYAFDHPEDAWPEFRPGAGLAVAGLGHPLLPEGGVRNDLALGGEHRLLVVSGSNMSGKSTLLRAVGTAVVMAGAGAPVRAGRLELEPLALGASIATHDSLQEGSSRFYAEITRLRQILDLTDGGPTVLFLLDELLSGTNSHDRRIGAEAIVRALVDRGALGLVTTHDLALARIAEALGPRAANIHFQDTLVEGRISFDYRIRPGVVERSNALELMRSVGLSV